MQKIELPVFENFSEMDNEQLYLLQQKGFCYVRVPQEVCDAAEKISHIAREFFHLSESEKKENARSSSGEGYMNHLDRGDEIIQRYIFLGNEPPEPMRQCFKEMLLVRRFFKENIALPLLKQLFFFVQLEEYFDEALQAASATLSLIYYPPHQTVFDQRLIEHVDAVPLTVLFISEEGLEVEIDQQWYRVDPRFGYVIVNIGKTLEHMTGGEYQAVKHRVNVSLNTERLSMASFIAPDGSRPLKDYKNSRVLYEHYQDFMTEQLNKVYPPTKK